MTSLYDLIHMNAASMTLIELCDAANHLPRRHGKKIHVKTIKRWIIKGCRGVRLGGQKVGDIWFTSVAWLREFQDACTRRATPDGERPPAVITAASRAAREELQRRYGFDAREASKEAEVSHVQAAKERRGNLGAMP